MKKQYIIRIILLLIISGALIINYSCKKDEEEPLTPTPNPATLFSDDFKSVTLKDGWYWANEPESWNINTTRIDYLHFKGEQEANIWCEDKSSRLYQVISEDQDFDVSVHMRCIWGNNPSDIAGIICKSATSGEWIVLKFWMHGDLTGRLEFQTPCNDILSPVPGSEWNGGDVESFLRIKKVGHDYSTYFKVSEGDEWTFVGTAQFSDQLPLHIGFFGGIDSGNGELIVEVDNFIVN